jgi:hypothetical protein
VLSDLATDEMFLVRTCAGLFGGKKACAGWRSHIAVSIRPFIFTTVVGAFFPETESEYAI